MSKHLFGSEIWPENNINIPPTPINQTTSELEHIKTLEELKLAIAEVPCDELKNQATNLVFNDGVSSAKIMVIGEAPGAEEDLQGKPFVGQSGKLLDSIFASIGLSRDQNIYISNIIPWRPPNNRTPKDEEIALFLPYVKQHIALKEPDIIILVGGVAAKAVLGTKDGILKTRGKIINYTDIKGRNISAIATLHPAYLLRSPMQKRLVWQDMLMVKQLCKEKKINV